MRKFKIVGALLFLTVLTACSAVSLVYNTAETLLYVWVDQYVDFTNAQSLVFKDRTAKLQKWHRKNELPRYADFLERSAALMPGELQPAELCLKVEEVQGLLRTSFNQITPDLAELAVTVEPDQITHLKKAFDKNNREWIKKNLPEGAAARKRALVEQAVDRYESFYGNFTREQEATLANMLSASPWDPERWLMERKRRQQGIVDLLQTARGQEPGEMQKKISTYYTQLEVHPDPVERSWIESLRTFACQFNADVHKEMNVKQRTYAKKKLLSYASDFRALAAAK
jgi:hypothetical protein